ncbi:MAG: phage baseplate assembly protein V [Thermoanaerobaculia bacterium]|nr:phage baseplate assembly protein V [Thermoanaerobaculia bacterium]
MTNHSAMGAGLDSRLSTGYGGRFYGVYAAVVIDVVDGDDQGRVRIRLPWSPDADGSRYEAWARLATMMAGQDRGSWFVPDPDDEVLVAFEAGDPRRPYVVGALWNGQDAPPASMDGAGRNEIKRLRSRSGVTVTLDDASGQERLTLETPGGQTVELRDGPGEIELRDQNGNTVKLEPAGVTVNAAAKVTVQASTVEITAGQVTVSAGLSRFSGVVQADTVITNAVVSSSYTPGAGNIW